MSNLLKDTHPHLYDEIDKDKCTSDEIKFEKITFGSERKIWWKCTKGNHSYLMNVHRRTSRDSSCPYCSNNSVLVGFNDIWTTDVELAKQLLNPEDGYKYSYRSGQKVDWKCTKCEHVVRQKVIREVQKQGSMCMYCSENYSFPERTMSNLLRQLNIVFEYQKKFDWIPKHPYDYYIPSLNCIIETHGGHHYYDFYKKQRKQTLEETKRIDKMKKEEAYKYGIKYYIELNCSDTDLQSLIDSFSNNEVFNQLIKTTPEDWKIVANRLSTKNMEICWEKWNSGMKNTREISELVGLSGASVLTYLKHGDIAGRVGYSKQEAIKNRSRKNLGKIVVQLELDGTFIKEWRTVSDAEKSMGVGKGYISSACKDESATVRGFRWRYKTDYDKQEVR